MSDGFVAFTLPNHDASQCKCKHPILTSQESITIWGGGGGGAVEVDDTIPLSNEPPQLLLCGGSPWYKSRRFHLDIPAYLIPSESRHFLAEDMKRWLS